MMMTNSIAIGTLASALTQNDFSTSYLGELTRFLGLSTLNPQLELSLQQVKELQNILVSLTQQAPIEYLVGEAVFYERRFKVTKDVLIPRFDTEGLIQKGLDISNKVGDNLSIIDIGTGSGAIIITMAKELAKFVNTSFVAIDISAAALAIAKENAISHGVLEKIDFQLADTFPLDSQNKPFVPKEDTVLIISNPPYISDKFMTALPDSVKNYEPDLALRIQKDFLPKLREYISMLESLGKTIYLALEYNNSEGVMEQFLLDSNNRHKVLRSLQQIS